MLKCFIPIIDFKSTNKTKLFVLTRPFFKESGWCNDEELKVKWGATESLGYTNVIEEASFLLIPLQINYYVKTNQLEQLRIFNALCETHGIKGYGYISGDFGQAYPEFSNLIYFRMGGFKRQLSIKNIGFPASLSDHFKRLYALENPLPRKKSIQPIIGFCGHATNDTSKRIKELVKCLLENGKRFLQNPLRRDWEPLFASAFERWQLLKLLEQSSELDCRFIYRDHYRGGAQNQQERVATTLDYYNNIIESDYVICVRGAGNFSVRLYETLMMGKIPIFVDTDCLLPFENVIDWKQHVVWIAWEERKNIATIVNSFHHSISSNEFLEIQKRNRNLWKNKLSVGGMLGMIANDFQLS